MHKTPVFFYGTNLFLLWFHHVSSVFSPEDLVGRSFKKDAGLDEIEAAMKSRQAEIDKLLKAAEAAIARPLACKIVGMHVNVSIFTLYKDVLDCQTIHQIPASTPWFEARRWKQFGAEHFF